MLKVSTYLIITQKKNQKKSETACLELKKAVT